MTQEKDVNLEQIQVLETEGDFGSLVGASDVMKAVYRLIEKVAPLKTTVLITGESGTGKEFVALEIYRRSKRAQLPFVPLNCAAVAETLLESELFGHERGSFTGAVAAYKGVFQVAHKGTVFLDEIAEASAAMQAKLLRALQEREVKPVGAPKPIPVDIRLISASSVDRLSNLRPELFYRLNVIHIALPPLRERKEDIALLADHFLRKFTLQFERPDLKLSAQACDQLAAPSWPGNVRQLEGVMESAVALTEGMEIGGNPLQEMIERPVWPGFKGKPKESAAAASDTDSEAVGGGWLTLEELEKRHIRRVLESVGGDKLQAARILGINRRALYRQLGKKAEAAQE